MKNPFGKDYEIDLDADKSTVKTNTTEAEVCKELEAEDWPAGVKNQKCDGTTITLTLKP